MTEDAKQHRVGDLQMTKSTIDIMLEKERLAIDARRTRDLERWERHKEKCASLLREGDVIDLGEAHMVELKEYTTRRAKDLERWGWHRELEAHRAELKKDRVCAGRYIVCKASRRGGGSQGNDSVGWPDEHYVHCYKADDAGVVIGFYQTGRLLAPTIKGLKPVAHVDEWETPVVDAKKPRERKEVPVRPYLGSGASTAGGVSIGM